jgi:hypothetical protein
MSKEELNKMKYQLKNLKPAERMPSWAVNAIFEHIEDQEVRINRLNWLIENCATSCKAKLDDKSGAV